MNRSGAGDPARTLELLWRSPSSDVRPSPGPKPSLAVSDVVAAAVTLADTIGLERLTMRAVAEPLGVAAMSLYTYVPGKAELIDLMLDTVYLRMQRTPLTDLPWRERLMQIAGENRELFRLHPWVVGIATTRPALGPGAIAKYEHELSAFDNLGLDDITTDDALTYLLTFVQASARAAHDAKAIELESAMNDEQWWQTNAPLLALVFDPRTYPRAARIGAAAGTAHGTAYHPDHAYAFGLSRVLDGLATLIEPAWPTP
jgi:AcrR family transcriptional regulator